ncbi:MAG: hypothetical protein AAEI92_01815 [Arenicellales bacterium]
MANKVFIPLSDDLIYEHPELILGPITAFDPANRQDSGSSEARAKVDRLIPAARHPERKIEKTPAGRAGAHYCR